jgi:serine/threonine protein kinase
MRALTSGDLELCCMRPFSEDVAPCLIDAILHKHPTSLREMNSAIPAELERIVLKCLEKDPEDRYQSAKELVVDLRRLEATSTAVAGAVPRRKLPRRWLVLAINGAGICALIAATLLFWPPLSRNESATTPSLRWEQLTNFNDSAEIPALSSDGKLVAFLRGPGSFGSSTNTGQIWLKSLPDGEPFQITKTAFRKQTINFSQDSSRVYFTQVEGPFAWNTYELALLGGQEPKLFMANATGLSWIGSDRLLFSTIRAGIHMKLSTSNVSRSDERDIYVHPIRFTGWCTAPRCPRMGNGFCWWKWTARGGDDAELRRSTAHPRDGRSDQRVRVLGPSGPPTVSGCTLPRIPGPLVLISGGSAFPTEHCSS